MTLDEYLADQAGKRWAWGSVDCVSFGLAWARERTGRALTPFCEWCTREEAEAVLERPENAMNRGGIPKGRFF